MKLTTKISVAATVSLLLFSQIILWYLLFQSNQTMMENKVTLEGEKLEHSYQQLEEMLEKAERMKTQMNTPVIISCFREFFQMHAALYQGEKEVWNMTPYEFSADLFWDSELKEVPDLPHILYVQTKVGKTDLLLMERTIQYRGEEYQIFQYQDLTEIYNRLKNLFFQGIFLSGVLILLMNAALYGVVKKILQPFYDLKRTANIISSGKYEERAKVCAKDEIGEVSESFNKMAEKVQDHIRELSDLNESQRQMMGSLAHELRTPMTAIQGYAETLLRVRISEERRIKALQYIESESKRLSRLSQKMLELTGLYHAEGTVTFERHDAEQLLEEAKEIFQAQPKQKKIAVKIRKGSEKIQITGEKDLLITFLINCMENAYRASKEGAVILLGAEENKIWVQDFGIGIAKEEIGKLTEAFYMADRSRSRKEGGAGLGLALCEQIAKLHHARIEIESEEGKGSTVTLVFEKKDKEESN